MTKNKRSQEEIIGLVVIIALVVVVAVIFLGISLRKTTTLKTSSEISNFLVAAKVITTDCTNSPERAYTLEDLIDACAKQESCLDNRDACGVLNKTFTEIIEAGFILKEGKYKGYESTIFVNNQTLVKIKRGNETNSVLYSKTTLYSLDSGDIELKVFTGS